MDRTKENRLVIKDFRILLGSLILYILVKSIPYFGEWFGMNAFWIIILLMPFYIFLLVGWLLFEIYEWIKEGFKKMQLLWIYLVTIGILIISIYGMR